MSFRWKFFKIFRMDRWTSGLGLLWLLDVLRIIDYLALDDALQSHWPISTRLLLQFFEPGKPKRFCTFVVSGIVARNPGHFGLESVACGGRETGMCNLGFVDMWRCLLVADVAGWSFDAEVAATARPRISQRWLTELANDGGKGKDRRWWKQMHKRNHQDLGICAQDASAAEGMFVGLLRMHARRKRPHRGWTAVVNTSVKTKGDEVDVVVIGSRLS